MKKFLILALTLIIGLAIGGYLGGSLGGKGGSILAMCNMAKVAQDEGMLSQAQTLDLAEATGRSLKKEYALIADELVLSEKSQGNVSSASECSNFLLRLSQGIDSVK